MGHVINPISLRVGYTLTSPFVLSSRVSHNYSFILHKTNFFISYIRRLFSHPSLRYSWLLSGVRVFYHNSYYALVVSLYSQRIFTHFLSMRDRLLPQANSGVFFSPQWFLFLMVRNFYLCQTFTLLRNVIERDLLSHCHTLVRQFFFFVPQHFLSAQSWVYFIKYKLKKNASFSSIMLKITPVLNQLLYEKKMLLGYKVACSGRTSRRGRASFSFRSKGKLPLSSVVSFVSYAFGTVVLKNSICGIKIWLFFKRPLKLLSSGQTYTV